jgi:hypothetical protein
MVDQDKIAFVAPGSNIDQIIFSRQDTVSQGGTTTYSNITDPNLTIVGDALPIGIYTPDGGASWYEMNGLDGPNPMVIGKNPGASLYLRAFNAGTFTYKMGLISLNNTDMVVTPVKGNVISYRAKVNYMKIHATGTSARGNSIYIISHNLGYIPVVRSWIKDGSSIIYSGDFNAATIARIDSTSLYLEPQAAASGQFIYRIYKEL